MSATPEQVRNFQRTFDLLNGPPAPPPPPPRPTGRKSGEGTFTALLVALLLLIGGACDDISSPLDGRIGTSGSHTTNPGG